jgi:hypothetical protein
MAARIEVASAELCELTEKPDLMASEYAIALKVESARTRLKSLVAESKEKAADLLANERANLAQNQSQKANFVPSAFAVEIRAVFRNLTMAEKIKFIDQAIYENDAGTVAAITTVPALLTGLPSGQAAHYHAALMNKLAPVNDAYVPEVEDGFKGVLDCASALVA